MKRTLLLAACLCMLAASAAHAGGFNIAWGYGCWPENPTSLVAYACDSNDGRASFAVSFSPDQSIPQFREIIVVADLQSDTSGLPDWWQLSADGGCRQGSLTTSADFGLAPGLCADPWSGQHPIHGTLFWVTQSHPEGWPVPPANRAQFRDGYYVNSLGLTVRQGTEYHGLRATIDYQKAVGAGGCAGCGIPVTIVLNAVVLGGGAIDQISSPLVNGCLRWQANGATPCSATPARNSTWGQVKGLYR